MTVAEYPTYFARLACTLFEQSHGKGMSNAIKTIKTKVIATLVHPCGATIRVLASPDGHCWADHSDQTELEWLGGRKSAREFIWRRTLRGGFTKV